eukprot:9240835-Pyramimonas_sp.AAC.2
MSEVYDPMYPTSSHLKSKGALVIHYYSLPPLSTLPPGGPGRELAGLVSYLRARHAGAGPGALPGPDSDGLPGHGAGRCHLRCRARHEPRHHRHSLARGSTSEVVDGHGV